MTKNGTLLNLAILVIFSFSHHIQSTNQPFLLLDHHLFFYNNIHQSSISSFLLNSVRHTHLMLIIYSFLFLYFSISPCAILSPPPLFFPTHPTTTTTLQSHSFAKRALLNTPSNQYLALSLSLHLSSLLVFSVSLVYHASLMIHHHQHLVVYASQTSIYSSFCLCLFHRILFFLN